MVRQGKGPSCAGCKRLHAMGGGVEVEVAPRRLVTVCRERGLYGPKELCSARAFIAARCCPGCGDTLVRGWSAGDGSVNAALCMRCREKMQRADDALRADLAKSLDLVALKCYIKRLPVHGGFGDRIAHRVAAAAGVLGFNDTFGHRRSRERFPKYGVGVFGKRDSPDTGRPWVELHPTQVVAVEELYAVLEELLEAVYQEGFKKGRSMLAQLASGELSSVDFDAGDSRKGSR